MAEPDLNQLLAAASSEDVSTPQMYRVIDAFKHMLNRRVHVENLVKLAKSQWMPVESMSAESDGKNVYLRLTLKIVVGKSGGKES